MVFISSLLQEYIHYRRTFLGWTQQEVSQKIKITEAAYSRIEKGRSVPRIETMLAICEELQFDWRYIKHIYLACIDYPPQLLEIAAWSFRVGDTIFAKRVLSKVFAIAKKTHQQHLLALGLFQILYRENYKNKRLADAVAEHMRMLGRRRTAELVERVVKS